MEPHGLVSACAELEKTSTTRASFTGLPAELRLQIYCHLFDSIIISNIREDAPNGPNYAHPAEILVTSRTIFQETMPILYRKAEINLHIQPLNQDQPNRIEKALSNLPTDSLKHITSLSLLPGRSTLWSSPRYWFNASFGYASHDWDDLQKLLPNLVVLSILTTATKEDIQFPTYSVFDGLLRSSKLQTIDIYVSAEKRFCPTRTELLDLAGLLENRLIQSTNAFHRRLHLRVMAV